MSGIIYVWDILRRPLTGSTVRVTLHRRLHHHFPVLPVVVGHPVRQQSVGVNYVAIGCVVVAGVMLLGWELYCGGGKKRLAEQQQVVAAVWTA